MPTAGNVPTAKIANCHTHPVALLPRSAVCTISSPVGVLATQQRSLAHQSFCTSWLPWLSTQDWQSWLTPQNPRKKAPQIPSRKATTAIPHNNFCQPLTVGYHSVGRSGQNDSGSR
jgi:hypothetical protein